MNCYYVLGSLKQLPFFLELIFQANYYSLHFADEETGK